uniref:ankyrin repeat domain-containing protein n=1 Tax=Thiocapsa sp. TaxID=2024551 RepID=UPI0035942D13
MTHRVSALVLAAVLSLAGCTEPAAPTVNLHRAVEIGDIDQVSRHIYWKSDLGEPDARGDPPLHVAAREGFLDVLQVLLEAKVDVRRRCCYGLTPLMLACSEHRHQAVKA